MLTVTPRVATLHHASTALSNANTQPTCTWEAHVGARVHGLFPSFNRFVGLMVKASASRAEDPGFESRLCCGDFSGVKSYL